jgi:hypothetical protein
MNAERLATSRRVVLAIFAVVALAWIARVAYVALTVGWTAETWRHANFNFYRIVCFGAIGLWALLMLATE